MIQPQWPGLGPSYTPPPFPGGSYGAIEGTSASPPASSDGISPGWWNGSSGNASGYSGYGSSGSSMYGVLQSLLGMLGQLVNGLVGGSGSSSAPSGSGSWGGSGTGSAACGNGGCAPGAWGTYASQSPANQPAGGPPPPQQQYFNNVTISSTGDPHIAETGSRATPGGSVAVDEHYDSMSSHGDLADARSVAGGYRVATTVTQLGKDGITYNQSATVYANGNQDAITMNRNGSFSITSDGQSESLGRGESLTLAGGETVTENQDGSLAVSASNGRGGSITTSMRGTGSGVDVTVTANNIGIGGDVVGHDAGSGWEPPAPARHAPWRDTDGVAAATT
jgi:hypothetical protein